MQKKHGLTPLQGCQGWDVVLLCFSAVTAHSWGVTKSPAPRNHLHNCFAHSSPLFYNSVLQFALLFWIRFFLRTPNYSISASGSEISVLSTNTKIFNRASKAREDIHLPHQPHTCKLLLQHVFYRLLNFEVHKDEIGSNNGIYAVWCQACCLEQAIMSVGLWRTSNSSQLSFNNQPQISSVWCI